MTASLLLITMLASAPDVTAQVEAIWKPLQPAAVEGKPSSWSWRLTPALPGEWPPKSNAAPVVRYAWAVRLDPSLRDGERTSAPFASIELAPDDTVKVSALVNQLGALERQGVVPITPDEAERLKSELIEPARAGNLSLLRVPWCSWLKYNGVVGAQLKKRHAAFFEALQCSAVKSAK